MSSSSSVIFSGTSRFSSDFQNVISRAVAIASLPIQQLQNDVSALQAQSSELGTLSSSFSALQSALGNIGSASGLASFTSSVSDRSVISVGLTNSPMPATISVDVVDVGAYATSLSSDGLTKVVDPAASSLSDATSYTLKIGNNPFTITPTGKSLANLADAINRNSNAGVQAAIINLGSNSSPDYRLSLQGTALGDQPIQLTATDGSQAGQDLLTAGAAGAVAKYRVNGKPATPIESSSRTVTLAPGVSATLLAEGGTNVTISRTSSALSSALASLASAYNAAQSVLDRNRGQGAGALKGESLLNTLSESLHKVSQYSTGGAGIASLDDIGLAFDKDGVMTFDATAFATAYRDHQTEVTDFLGSATTGGFLKTATDNLTTLTDPSTGVLVSSTKALSDQVARENDDIAERQARIDDLQTSLQEKMSAADAAIAALEQQYSYISNMFTAMRDANNNQ